MPAGDIASVVLEQHLPKMPGPEALPTAPEGFDEGGYLAANPDVAAAVLRGEVQSGYEHYVKFGWREKRLRCEPGDERRGRLVRTLSASVLSQAVEAAPQANVEAVVVSPGGGILLVGWLDDTNVPLDYIRIEGIGWHYTFDLAGIGRFRRADVEAVLATTRPHEFGFFAFAFVADYIVLHDSCEVVVGLRNASRHVAACQPQHLDEVALRDVVLTYVAEQETLGNREVQSIRMLDGPIGRHIIAHNLLITRQVVAGAHVERFARPRRRLSGSMVVCLYGKPEYFFLQSALFAGGAGFDDYETIYVSNSPEMAERLMKEARVAERIYGLPQTVVLLPGNAGFGAANNVAAQHASSDRILIVNPDVFPRDPDWARKHTEAVTALPGHQTALFGAPLYYDDGTLMHGGMYFEFDAGVSIDADRVRRQRLLRVEHYGKGAPSWAAKYTEPRPVQAVTGAFMSLDRGWFEKLGGFTEDYVFGHYEDADLCLKSIERGVAPWLHDIRMWHLEGKGSIRRPVHEGGSLVNRWLFAQRWTEMIERGLEGPAPLHPLLNPKAAARKPGKPPRARARPAPQGARPA